MYRAGYHHKIHLRYEHSDQAQAPLHFAFFFRRIFFGAVLTLIALIGGCTCRASVKPVATAVPTKAATMAPVATAVVTVVPEPSDTPMASGIVSPSASPATSEGTGSGTP